MPCLLHRESHVLSPSLIVSVGHTSIPITVEDKHIGIGHQKGVSVGGKVGAGGLVRPARSSVAHGPTEARVADVKGFHHIGLVEVSRGSGRVDTCDGAMGNDALKLTVVGIDKGGLRGGDIDFSTGRDLSSHNTISVGTHIGHTVTVNVVHVDVANLGGSIVQKRHTLCRQSTLLVGLGSFPVALSVNLVLEVSVNKASLNQVLPLVKGSLGSRSTDTDLGTSASVSDCDSSKLGSSVTSIFLAINNSLGKGGHVDTSV
mmetsp:Transcript_14442/g.31395  ORF Transcript_14442/g.31395 Transcript_14442/m.31395 type:complete len:259 (-) Transcript_14442:511-1287(-)